MLPPTQRLREFKQGKRRSRFEAKCFQFGRYALASSSRAGGQPANLQGIWNESVTPSWGSKYTININTQMNYWPAEVCNLSECHQPLFDMLKDIAVTGTETARVYYDRDGWVHASQRRSVGAGRLAVDARRASACNGLSVGRGSASICGNTTLTRRIANSSKRTTRS